VGFLAGEATQGELQGELRETLVIAVLWTGKEALVEVAVVVRQSVDGHGVEQFLPPVGGGAVLDVRVRRQEHPHVVDAAGRRRRLALGGRQRLVDARTLHHDQPVPALSHVQMPRRPELQHAELASEKRTCKYTQ